MPRFIEPEREYFIVAVVELPDGRECPVRCWKHPQPKMMNLLYVLCEHVGHRTSINEICARLKVSDNALRIIACRLRKRLDRDWIVETVNNQGMRIVYNAPDIIEQPRTRLIVKRRRAELEIAR